MGRWDERARPGWWNTGMEEEDIDSPEGGAELGMADGMGAGAGAGTGAGTGAWTASAASVAFIT